MLMTHIKLLFLHMIFDDSSDPRLCSLGGSYFLGEPYPPQTSPPHPSLGVMCQHIAVDTAISPTGTALSLKVQI